MIAAIFVTAAFALLLWTFAAYGLWSLFSIAVVVFGYLGTTLYIRMMDGLERRRKERDWRNSAYLRHPSTGGADLDD